MIIILNEKGTMLHIWNDQIMIYPYKGTLLTIKKGKNPEISNIDESQKKIKKANKKTIIWHKKS